MNASTKAIEASAEAVEASMETSMKAFTQAMEAFMKASVEDSGKASMEDMEASTAKQNPEASTEASTTPLEPHFHGSNTSSKAVYFVLPCHVVMEVESHFRGSSFQEIFHGLFRGSCFHQSLRFILRRSSSPLRRQLA